MIRSLHFRLAAGAVIAIGLSLTLVWFALSRLFTDYVVSQYVSEMTVLSDSLTASITIHDGKLALTSTPSDPRLNLPAGGRYWAIGEGDRVLQRSRSFWDATLTQANMRSSGYAPFLEAVGPGDQSILVLTQDSSIGESQSTRRFSIHTSFPKAELERALATFHSELLRMLVVTAALLSLAAIVQAIVGLSPLDKLRQKVIEIRRGSVARIGEEGPSEVRPLVREMDLLLQEREEAIERARSRASDLAHGLKTPLTVLSQLAAELGPTSAQMALKQVDLIRQRADRQLQAARLGVERMMSADVGELAGKLIQVLKPVHADRGIQWQLEVKGDVRVEADPADLAEALGNVLDNASKWARSQIAVTVVREDQDVAVRISDDGPGVSSQDLSSVLTRGRHGAGANSGSGLGLAITADIAAAYGATLSLDRANIGGLAVTFRCPVKNVRRVTAPA